MRTIGIVTVGRSDYGIFRPLIQAVNSDPDLELQLIVGGMHLSPDYGLTKNDIEEDGYPVSAYVDMLLASNSAEAISKSIGLGVLGFSQIFSRNPPDILIVLGDRFEMFAAPIAALPFLIPVAHIHGGELTQGAFDDAIRHSITKLSHIHFASTQEYANRIVQLGEEPWRVHNVGALSVDNFHLVDVLDKEEFLNRFNLPEEFLLVTFHPITLESKDLQTQVENLIRALDFWGGDILFTMPNADPGGKLIRDQIIKNVNDHKNWKSVENLGTRGYYSAMRYASAMVGNSSSGIIESGLFNLPVVNIGSRQLGRIRGSNIIDVGYDQNEIISGIENAISKKKDERNDLTSPYGDGKTAERIVGVIKDIEINDQLITKKFYNL